VLYPAELRARVINHVLTRDSSDSLGLRSDKTSDSVLLLCNSNLRIAARAIGAVRGKQVSRIRAVRSDW
jgi:hypothetical protein